MENTCWHCSDKFKKYTSGNGFWRYSLEKSIDGEITVRTSLKLLFGQNSSEYSDAFICPDCFKCLRASIKGLKNAKDSKESFLGRRKDQSNFKHAGITAMKHTTVQGAVQQLQRSPRKCVRYIINFLEKFLKFKSW